MDALVGYSGSSDSEGDEDSAEKRKSDHGGTDVDDWDKKSRNFLLESASASSESDESDHGDRRQPYNSGSSGSSGPSGPGSRSQKSGPPATAPHKLPPPTLHGRSESSVFANPFKAQAEQKLSALQKHVPLTTEAKPSQIGGKRVCLSYRKSGRCRFGIKCKFAHDSDLQTALPPNDSREGRVRSQSPSPSPSPKEAERDPSEGRPAKRRRPGVADALVPPKKAMKHYNMLRSREQHKTC
ncbi:uncharacterized protein si:ch211-113e8.11 [Syngnathoides biaculeatus]|uniref:uncharacterized protein si:ch211-113e8.11 n=1 Tax=Syngnathoides biaculeatus TaxID=300417 RepID=UPI002ADD9DA3|nr:uncharacterized protein si:ch211-113e8.11 [Syngnathoides biaculeatus]